MDLAIFNFLNGFAGKSSLSDSIIIFLANYLSYLFVLALVVFFIKYIYPKKQVIIVAVVSAFLSRFVITEAIRFVYHRPRPFSVMHVVQLVEESKWSFPSGHASFFFALAAAVYFCNRKWGTGFFVAAFLIGVGRVMAGVHYPSDILGGAVIGIIVSYIVFFLARKFVK